MHFFLLLTTYEYNNIIVKEIYDTLLAIIIHSKYFPDSDWLKAHAYFTITSYWSPNLEEFCINWTDDVKSAAFLQVNAPLTEKIWGRGWVVLVVKTKMADISLVSRVRIRWNNSLKHSKNSKKTTQRATSAIWRIFYLWSWTTPNVHYQRWT